MRKSTYLFTAILMILSIGIYYAGCSNDPVSTPTGGGTTSIKANGTIQQITRTNSTGTLVVVDQNGSPITGLTGSNVTASMKWGAKSSDSVSGAVTVLSNSGSGKNVAGSVTMDYSGSMGTPQIVCMQSGVKTYVNAMGSNDLTEIIKFDNRVLVAQPFTSDKTLLNKAVDSVYSLGGTTALYQSIFKGIQDVQGYNSSTYIKSVIAFTDGGENASTVTRSQMITEALTKAIPVFSIYLALDSNNTQARDMRNIADTTGGFFFWAKPDSTCNSALSGVYNTIKGQIAGSYAMNITWPGGTLPPTGTLITITIYVTHSGMSSAFSKTFLIL
ncbi:MAG: vWA domain-containing protein [Ignavibacteria bacterium]